MIKTMEKMTHYVIETIYGLVRMILVAAGGLLLMFGGLGGIVAVIAEFFKGNILGGIEILFLFIAIFLVLYVLVVMAGASPDNWDDAQRALKKHSDE